MKQGDITPSEDAVFSSPLAKKKALYLLDRLWRKLKILGAGYFVGNTTTRNENEIVTVLDELKHRGGIIGEEYKNINTSISFSNTKMGSGIDGLWQRLNTLGDKYLVGNRTVKNELVDVLDELLKQNKISKGKYDGMTKLGAGIVLSKDSLRSENNKDFHGRLVELMEEIDIENLPVLFQRYLRSKQKVSSEIERILEILGVKKRTVEENEMLLSRVEHINKAVESF